MRDRWKMDNHIKQKKKKVDDECRKPKEENQILRKEVHIPKDFLVSCEQHLYIKFIYFSSSLSIFFFSFSSFHESYSDL